MDQMSQARALYAAGRIREAATLLEVNLQQKPRDADATQLLAAIRFQTGKTAEGRSLAERAVALDPNNGEAWNTLGLIRHLSGEHETALTAFAKATDAAPRFGEAWMNRGFVLQELGRQAESVQFFQQALAIGINNPQAHFFLGNAYAALGNHDKAIDSFDQAISLAPGFADAWNNRGNSLLAVGLVEEAAHSFERSAQLTSGGAKGGALTALQRGDMARTLQSHGRWRDAIRLVEDAREGELRFLSALIMPVLFESTEMVGEATRHLEEGLVHLRDKLPTLADPLRQVGVTAFHMPYFGMSERPYQEAIADLYRQAAPSLRFETSHTPRKASRTRLGVLSAYLRDHSVSFVFGRLIERLDQERFEVVYLQIGPGDARSERIARSAAKHVQVPYNLAEAQAAVAREELDVLFYPEVGADVLSYYLAFSRLAPVQCTTWGHPLTTGSPVMDHFISSRHLERDDGQTEYTENLALLPSLTTYYAKPEAPPPHPRSFFGLPENRRLYGCPQMHYKFHPAFDRVLAAILEGDDQGVLVLIEPERPYFKAWLLARWRKTNPIIADRAIWLRRMPLPNFLRLLQHCDALLAPIPFGAGRSSFDAFGVGAPVVTFKGPHLKSRITYAAYKEIGLDDLIAETEADYVRLALRLARDSAWQTAMRHAVVTQSDPLYESQSAVRELNDFLASVRPM